MGKNYYQTLGVARNAGEFDLKNAYRRLALKLHPQKNPANEDQFRAVAEAYTVLTDSQLRAKFDLYGEEGLKHGILDQSDYMGYQYVGDPLKLFYDFFGETSPYAILLNENANKFNLEPRNFKSTESDTQATINLDLRCTLNELYTGSTKTQKVDRQRYDHSGRSFVDTKVLTIKVEKSWVAGTKLRFKGEGHQLHPDTTGDSKAGDIVFTVVEEQHSSIERVLGTNDLLYVHKVGLLDAVTGHVVNMELLDGNNMNLHVSEQVTPTYEKRVVGHGMTGSNGQRGDLVVRWDIQFPILSPEQKTALKRIL